MSAVERASADISHPAAQALACEQTAILFASQSLLMPIAYTVSFWKKDWRIADCKDIKVSLTSDGAVKAATWLYCSKRQGSQQHRDVIGGSCGVADQRSCRRSRVCHAKTHTFEAVSVAMRHEGDNYTHRIVSESPRPPIR